MSSCWISTPQKTLENSIIGVQWRKYRLIPMKHNLEVNVQRFKNLPFLHNETQGGPESIPKTVFILVVIRPSSDSCLYSATLLDCVSSTYNLTFYNIQVVFMASWLLHCSFSCNYSSNSWVYCNPWINSIVTAARGSFRKKL